MSTRSPVPSPASFPRRLGALFYDSFLLLGLLFLATALILPFNGGQAFDSGHPLYRVYLLTVAFVFFGWFWTRGGQTLGMKAWGIKLCAADGLAVTWRQALVRFSVASATLGLGLLWALVDRRNCGWHDRMSDTRLCLTQTGDTKSGGRQHQ